MMKRCSRFSRWQAIVLCGLMTLGTVMVTERLVQAQQYRFTDLGDLGGGRSFANGINNSGQVVGWSTVPGNYQHAFLYKNRMMMSLSIGGILPSATGINDSEQVIGATDSIGRGQAFVYSNGGLTLLPAFTSGGYSAAYGINKSGDVVGVAKNSSTAHAVLYTGGRTTPKNLNIWKGLSSVAYGINDSGQVVGAAALPKLGPIHAFLYSNGNMEDLSTLGGPTSAAYGINNSGQVVGQAAFLPKNTAVHAFLYNPGQKMKDLSLGGPPGLALSVAKGINKSGQVVGWYNIAGSARRAFISTNGAPLRDLNALMDSTGAGWTLQEATAINDNGQIVGNAVNKVGSPHGFLLTPVPFP